MSPGPAQRICISDALPGDDSRFQVTHTRAQFAWQHPSVLPGTPQRGNPRLTEEQMLLHSKPAGATRPRPPGSPPPCPPRALPINPPSGSRNAASAHARGLFLHLVVILRTRKTLCINDKPSGLIFLRKNQNVKRNQKPRATSSGDRVY